MKLLLDQNLSYRVLQALEPHFPGSEQVMRLRLDRVDDLAIWQYAGSHGFTVVSQDTDFRDYPAVHGTPPKLVILRCGNQPNAYIAELLIRHADQLRGLPADPDHAVIEIG